MSCRKRFINFHYCYHYYYNHSTKSALGLSLLRITHAHSFLPLFFPSHTGALSQFSCGRSSHCRPCFVDQPDCTNLPDGDNPFPGQPFTPKFARCQQGRSLGVGLCSPVSSREPRLFDPRVGGCASARSIPRSLGGAGEEDN